MAKQLVVGISGASGALYAQRLLQLATAAGCEVHLVVSVLGQRLLHDELGMEGVDLDALTGGRASQVTLYNIRDVGARIASGSFAHDGMVVVPCSSNTLSAVATGQAQNLMHRAAHVTLKERRRLVLMHRETPLSLIDIRNMEQATLAGAVLCPANPGFYLLPRKIEDLVDFVVARAMDLMGIEHGLNLQWPGHVQR